MEPFLQRNQKSKDSVSKWNGFCSSNVNARPIRTNFGSIPFGTVPFGSSVNGVYILVTFELYIILKLFLNFTSTNLSRNNILRDNLINNIHDS